ncbi:MAG TPA: hypothetical protein VF601_05985 [Beijerinckiaceae bacterium]|jgi:hypothetical protein
MASSEEVWKPGSFTKNFSWGERDAGLLQLHESIRIGFDHKLKDVPREEFRRRIRRTGRVDYIPANFFVFNKRIGGVDHVIVDELVFQALTSNHSPRFDKLALFAFNFSYVGSWSGADEEQSRPALWAYHYIKDRVAAQFDWSTKFVSANDIERFVRNDPRYKAKTARKLSTNLNYLYEIAYLDQFREPRVERWWVDALFLALDRLIEDRALRGRRASESQYRPILDTSGFQDIAGKRSLEKDLAVKHLITLYIACGGRERFSEEAVKERTALKLQDLGAFDEPNDEDPRGAVHPTNPRILKSIPRACAMLATYAGFDVISALAMEEFDPEVFIRERTQAALASLREQGIEPTMTAEEVLRLTRER